MYAATNPRAPQNAGKFFMIELKLDHAVVY